MSEHQIVVIGASFAGNVLASSLLRDILPSIATADKKFKVTQIAPTDEFFWKIGAPRTLIRPDVLPLDKTLVSITSHFSKYPAEQYTFIKALVTSIDRNAHTLTLSTSTTVPYDTLIICSGTIFQNDLWSTARGSEPLRAAIADLHSKLPTAQTIVVGGGGPAGVETAGELGDAYPGGKKDITLYSGTSQLLNYLNHKGVGKDAESRLTKQGIKTVHNVQITSHTRDPATGKETLQLSNGETKTVDIYIEAIGDKPNSSFVPKEWLDDKGRVLTDPQTLRATGEGAKGVYAYGTVGSYSNGSIADVMFAKKAILETLKNDLAGKGMSNSYLTLTSWRDGRDIG